MIQLINRVNKDQVYNYKIKSLLKEKKNYKNPFNKNLKDSLNQHKLIILLRNNIMDLLGIHNNLSNKIQYNNNPLKN